MPPVKNESQGRHPFNLPSIKERRADVYWGRKRRGKKEKDKKKQGRFLEFSAGTES